MRLPSPFEARGKFVGKQVAPAIQAAWLGLPSQLENKAKVVFDALRAENRTNACLRIGDRPDAKRPGQRDFAIDMPWFRLRFTRGPLDRIQCEFAKIIRDFRQ